MNVKNVAPTRPLVQQSPSQPRPPRSEGVTVTVRPGDSFFSLLQREGRAITGRELSPLELTLCAQLLERTSVQRVEPGRTVTISAADLAPVLTRVQAEVARGVSSFDIGWGVERDLYGGRPSAGRQYVRGVRDYQVRAGESVASIAQDIASTFAADFRLGWTQDKVLQLAAALMNGVTVDGHRVALFEPGKRLQAGEVLHFPDLDLFRVAESLGLRTS
ncbi:MAG: hypothetical protein IT380_29970 [Myxococcales bacterium]|nr:hypothetical protein [Myxococcales bacterium]